MSFVGAGRKEAYLAAGGRRVRDKCYFIELTLLVKPGLGASVYKYVFFILTACILVEFDVDTVEKATLYTPPISCVLRVPFALESGTVGVNPFFLPDVQVPVDG
ncbi:hypothetical protein B0J12DRAFT_747245 [Macrophomina phaseolina]|uniref:Uncharacterized protein n=1 Tax=Macrophomina phaseolina TaxID=35725 RepID=A0ABQ8FQJ3_9PEZI|nr:hypothetical protein B0J12DRAFT_747245 [Macrophomina phaseolina]